MTSLVPGGLKHLIEDALNSTVSSFTCTIYMYTCRWDVGISRPVKVYLEQMLILCLRGEVERTQIYYSSCAQLCVLCWEISRSQW
jgi:hypothetical protein